MATCIHLNQRFGKKYRLERDPAYYVEHGARGRSEDPWLWIVVGRFADIFPWGGKLLGLSTHGRGARAHRLAALPFVTVVQDAEDGYTLTFDVERFAEVAKLAGLRRKRRLTQALLEGCRKTRFKTAVSARNSSASASGQPRTTKVSFQRATSDLAAQFEQQTQKPILVEPRTRYSGCTDGRRTADAQALGI